MAKPTGWPIFFSLRPARSRSSHVSGSRSLTFSNRSMRWLPGNDVYMNGTPSHCPLTSACSLANVNHSPCFFDRSLQMSETSTSPGWKSHG